MIPNLLSIPGFWIAGCKYRDQKEKQDGVRRESVAVSVKAGIDRQQTVDYMTGDLDIMIERDTDVQSVVLEYQKLLDDEEDHRA